MTKSTGAPSIRLQPLGWLKLALERDAEGFAGQLDKLCPDADSGIFAQNKALPQNKVTNTTNETWSAWWPGETEGNWTEAFVRLAYALGDGELIEKAKGKIDRLLEHQEADGYIGINTPENRFKNGAVDGELWTQSRAMRILLTYLEYQEDDRVLSALLKMADLTVRAYGPLAGGKRYYEVPDADGSKGHGLMVIEPLLALYKQSGKQEYLDFCVFLYDDFSNGTSVFPVDDLRLPQVMDKEAPFVGHGPHICENLRIPLLLYAATNESFYLDAFLAGYQKAVGMLSLSGSMKSDELAGAPFNALSGEKGIHLGGCPPLPEAGYEYCSTVEWMLTMKAAAEILKDNAYLERFEWAVLNAAAAARQPDGKAIQYLCADNVYAATKERGARWDYSPTHEDAAVCCVPNAAKVWPLYASGLWAWQGGTLVAQGFAPSIMHTKAGGTAITITQQTAYPFQLGVQFLVNAQAPFTIALRIRLPLWQTGFTLKVNGKDVAAEAEGDYLTLNQQFSDGDRIELDFQAAPRVLTAVDGTSALACGPLMYSLPIDSEGKKTFDYGFGGFYDLDYTPKPDQRWDYTLVMKEGQPFVRVKQAEVPDNPWDKPNAQLEVVAFCHSMQPFVLSLSPMGQSRLRRSTFPAFESGKITGLSRQLEEAVRKA